MNCANHSQANASKTDSLLSQHAGKSLDELVTAKVINTDQKAQILKKPALQAQLTQYEEQLAQYQKVDEQYRTRAASDKAEWEKNLDKAKADAVTEANEGHQKTLREHLLLLSQFLRLAACRRDASEADSDESQAIEGVLLAIYAGDEGAVNAMLKLLEGSEDLVTNVSGEQTQTNCTCLREWSVFLTNTSQSPRSRRLHRSPRLLATLRTHSPPKRPLRRKL